MTVAPLTRDPRYNDISTNTDHETERIMQHPQLHRDRDYNLGTIYYILSRKYALLTTTDGGHSVKQRRKHD